jgi:hypothetical protein
MTARTRWRRRRARRRRCQPAGRRAGRAASASAAPRPVLADRSSARSQAGLVGTTRARPEFRVMGPALGADMGQSNPVLAGAEDRHRKGNARLAVRLLDQVTPAMPAGSQALPCPGSGCAGTICAVDIPDPDGRRQPGRSLCTGLQVRKPVRYGRVTRTRPMRGAGFTQSLTGWAATRPAR